MKSVTVRRHDLLEKLKTNREGHRALFLKAQEGYRSALILALDSALRDAQRDIAYRTYITLVAPEDHTSDYDTVIAMLEMSIEPEITVEQREFQCYVLDKWDWAAHALFLNSTYAGGGTVSPEQSMGKFR